MDVAELNALTREEFVARLGGIFEHAPWVAESAAAHRPFTSRRELHAAMCAAVVAAPEHRQLDLIRAHPDLAGRAAQAGALTEASTREQSGAGLDRLTPTQFGRLTELNETYRERFGFPYVVCVAEHDADGVIADAAQRLAHDFATERKAALSEIEKIASRRLQQAVSPRISYGKVEVPVHVVSDRGLLACEVGIEVLGDVFLPSYTEGDNSRVVATDTMKNVILRHALEQDTSSLEAFVTGLGRHFLSTYADMQGVRVSAQELPFEPITEKLFRRIDAERAVVEVRLDRDPRGEPIHRGTTTGVVGLRLLKTTGSSFTRFARDDETTLPERVDRPLYIHLDVEVDHLEPVAPQDVKAIVFGVFDEMVSESIQQLVYEMGQRLLATFPAITRVAFVAQNHTHDPVPGSPPSPQLPRAYTAPFPAWGNITLELER